MSDCNYEKEHFGRFLSEAGQHGFITSDRCFHYGSVSGCDEFCPLLNEGGCKNEKSKEMYLNVKEADGEHIG